MKRVVLIGWLFVSLSICTAQNLVPNGSFETYSQCPTSISQVELCTNWIQPIGGTPDYFNSCSSIPGLRVPSNGYGYQNAKTGNAYVGIITWEFSGPSYREYIEVELTSGLVAGSCYYIEMYANLSNISKYNLFNVGVYFSDTLVDSIQSQKNLSFIPHIQNTSSNLFDTLNWSLVSGYYTAQGGEQYLIIGNFHPDSLVNPVIVNPSVYQLSYLFIDDVSLTVCTGMEEFNQSDVNIAPTNPFTDKLTISASNNEPYEIMLTDITGRQVLKQNLSGNATVQTGSLGKGIYFVTLRKKEKVVTVKVVKQ